MALTAEQLYADRCGEILGLVRSEPGWSNEELAERLAEFPHRGTPREDLVPGMRTVPYRRRVMVAYQVLENCVEVLRLVQSGQDWEQLFE